MAVGHGENSSYFDGGKGYEKNPFHPVKNSGGVIQMGLAENQLWFDVIQNWVRNNPEASICTPKGVFNFKEIALFQDYHGLPEFRQAVANFMSKVRGNKCKSDPDRVVMSGGATGAHEMLSFCLADPGDAFLVSTHYPGGNSIVASSVLTAGEVVVGFMMMALLSLLQIQSQSISPFDSHPIKEFIFIVSLLLYAISLYIVKKIQTTNRHEYLRLCEDICFFLGSVGCDLLLFILVPLLSYMAGFFCLCLFIRIIRLYHLQLRHVLAQGYHWLHRVFIFIYSHASGSYSAGSDAAVADGSGSRSSNV